MAMDSRNIKLALARQKLKDHQEKKSNKHDDGEVLCHEKDVLKKTDMENLTSENLQQCLTTKNIVEENIGKNKEEADIQIQTNVVATEVLISNKRNLEIEIIDLLDKISHLEKKYDVAVTNNELSKQQIQSLETELNTLKENYVLINNQLVIRDKTLEEYKTLISSLMKEKTYFQEQMEFAKALVTTKETENSYLQSQSVKLQKQLEASELRLQQLSNDTTVGITNDNDNNVNVDQSELLLHKIVQLEQQLKNAQKERDQINTHFEHYVSELNTELKSAVKTNEELMKQIAHMSNRENNLIDQLGNMEIQLQNYRSTSQTVTTESSDNAKFTELQQLYDSLQDKFREMQAECNFMKEKIHESEKNMKEIEEKSVSDDNNENICISKLHADITNDKIAAQRATEQNVKLKKDLQELEEAFVKMSKDKLELTEKLEAEKFLNRELTIKLSENVEIAKGVQTVLKAKDEEMIRLQMSYREIEKQLLQDQAKEHGEAETQKIELENLINIDINEKQHHNEQLCLSTEQHLSSEIDEGRPHQHKKSNMLIPKEDAMLKLQNRFLKIMEEVADLSDEKHRLEHIIMQLQNETDTICEYVALYQQQRSLLKQRDDERSAQIKIFQSECEKMKTQLNELNEIIVKLTNDEGLSAYLQKEAKHLDISNALDLLNNMKTNFLINSSNQYADMHNFYPCACCSGNVIDI